MNNVDPSGLSAVPGSEGGCILRQSGPESATNPCVTGTELQAFDPSICVSILAANGIQVSQSSDLCGPPVESLGQIFTNGDNLINDSGLNFGYDALTAGNTAYDLSQNPCSSNFSIGLAAFGAAADLGAFFAPEDDALLSELESELEPIASSQGTLIPDAILDTSGRVHGTLPSAADLSQYDLEALQTLRDELVQSVQTRIANTIRLGPTLGHSDRLAQEQALIKSIDKYLADHG